MADPAEIKIKATGAADAQAAVKSVSETIAELAARSGLAAGELKIFETVLRQDTEAGIELTASLSALASAKGQVSEAVRQAAGDAFNYVNAANQTTAANQAAAQSASQTAAALNQLAPAATGAATALTQVGGAAGTAATGLGQAATATVSAGTSAAGAVGSFRNLYIALTLVRRGLEDLDKFRQAEESLEHLADATGISANELARFEAAIGRAGGDGDKFGQVLQRLARSFESARQGNVKMEDDLRRLGVTARDPIEAFYQIADTVHDTKDRFEALGVASQVLGRNSEDLVGILGQGSAALKANAQASAEVAEARASAIGPANDLTSAEAAFKENLTVLTAALLPAFTLALQVVGSLFNSLELTIAATTDVLVGGFLAGTDAAQGFGAVLLDVVTGKFSKAKVDASAALIAIAGDMKRTGAEIQKDWEKYMAFDAAMSKSPAAAGPGKRKPFPGPADKPGNNKTLESELDAQMAHNAAMAKLETAKADTALAIEKGSAEERIQAIENAHGREIAAALEELQLAEARASLVGTIDADELQRNIALLESKRKLAAQDKNGAAEVVRIDREIQAAKDQFAQRQQALIEAVEKARARAAQVAAAEARKTAEEGAKAAEDGDKALQKLRDKATEDARKADEEREAGLLQHAARMLAMERDRIETAFKLHQIGSAQRLEQLKQVDDRETQIERDALTREIADDAKTLAEKQRLYSQLQALEDKAALTAQKDNEQRLLTLQQQWDKYFAAINRGFTSTLDGMLTGQKSFGQSMQGLLGNLVTSSANALLQIALKHLESLAIREAGELGLSAVLKALHLTDAAAAVVTDKTTGADQVLTSAGVAAANAYAATAIIPFVGPELAPAAAATAYAGALSFGSLISAEGGAADIPGTTGAILHAREMVLPAELAERVRTMTGGAGSFTMGDVHVHNAGSNGAAIGKQILSTIKDHMRRNNMVPA